MQWTLCEYLFAEYILGIQGNNAHFLRIHSHNVDSVDHQSNNLSISLVSIQITSFIP